MYRAAWKSLLHRRARLLLSALAIVLGVAFVSGSLIFTTLLSTSFNGLLRGTVADVNVDPVGTYSSSGSRFDPATSTAGRALLTPAQLARLRSVPGVQSATGTVFSVNTYPIGSNGKVIATIGAPGVGINWYTDPAFGGLTGVVLKSGHPPQGPDEMVIDPVTLAKSGYRLGDRMRVSLPTGNVVTKTIVGTGQWGGGGTAGATYVFLTTPEAQKLLLGGRDGFTAAWITAEHGVSIPDLVARVRAVTPSAFEAVSGQAAADATASSVNKALSFINTFLLVFAAIALLVASFLIVNTFSIIVAHRGRELALFRAIGASRRQITRAVLFEAAVTGFVGSTLGLGLGWVLALGIRALFTRFGVDLGSALPVVPWSAVGWSYAVGMVITMVSAWLPGRKAGHVPPVAAMSGEVMTGTGNLGIRAAIGVAMTIAGAAAMGVGLWTHISHRALVIGVGAALVLLGVAAASPLLGRPVIALLGWVYRRSFGEVGKLAALNAVRQPRRTAATASALMLSLALVTTLSVLGSSASTSIHSVVTTTMASDFTLQSVTGGVLPAALPQKIAAVPGVAAAAPFYATYVGLDGRQTYLTVADASAFNTLIGQHLVSGRLNTADGSVIVDQRAAQRRGLSVGDTLVAVSPVSRAPVTLTVSGIYATDAGGSMGEYTVNVATGRRLGAADGPTAIAVTDAAGADPAKVRAGLDAATADLPTVVVMNRDEYANEMTSQVDRLLNMIYALLGLAIVIAVLGIVNTLALSVIERTREVGLLRAIGTTRPQLRLMVTLESVIIALLGSVLGVALGVAFGTALQRSLADSGLSHLVLPWGRLLLYLVAAVIVGVVAAVWPARHAARLNMLRAIATE